MQGAEQLPSSADRAPAQLGSLGAAAPAQQRRRPMPSSFKLSPAASSPPPRKRARRTAAEAGLAPCVSPAQVRGGLTHPSTWLV